MNPINSALKTTKGLVMSNKETEEKIKRWFEGGFNESYCIEPKYKKIVEFIDEKEAKLSLLRHLMLVENCYCKGNEFLSEKESQGWDWYIRKRRHRFDEFVGGMFLDGEDDFLEDKFYKLGEEYGEKARELEGRAVASIFNKGGFIRGDRETFDGNFFDEIYYNMKEPYTYDPFPNYIYDNTPFFSNKHRLKNNDTRTFSNIVIDAPINKNNFGLALSTICDLKEESKEKRKIDFMPDIVLCRPINVMKLSESIPTNLRNLFEIFPWEFLDDDNAWYIGKKNKGIRFYNYDAPSIKFVWGENKNGNLSDGVTIFIHICFGVGVTQWRYWCGMNISKE